MVVLAFVAFLTVVGGVDYHRTQNQLFAQLRTELGAATAPVAAPIAIGRPVAIVRIPKLHLRAVVVQGSSARELQRGPGHQVDTPLPGQPGTAVILGRRVAFGAPFADLVRLHPGDAVDVITGQGSFRFVVDATWRSDQTHRVATGSGPHLDLLTSDPAFTPSRTFVVSAHMTAPAVAAGAVATPQSHATALVGDPDAAITADLWAQALLVL
ncbi:MAG: sortase, partial [Frankiaceae bacterium]|nr:sortase [Frankiaceae bacterium]MBV9369098.1 sortase [Frankiales bacterium]